MLQPLEKDFASLEDLKKTLPASRTPSPCLESQVSGDDALPS